MYEQSLMIADSLTMFFSVGAAVIAVAITQGIVRNSKEHVYGQQGKTF